MEIQYEAQQQSFSLIGELNHIRKNHALEHATIHVLTKRHPGISFGGYSIHSGFWIIGKTDLESVKDAAEIARARLCKGEASLAVHPNCGTNLVMAGLCSAAVSAVAMAGADTKEKRLDRFPMLISAGILGTYFGRPLGEKVQKYLTTDPDVSCVQISGIQCSSLSGTPAFFVETELYS